MTVYFVVIDVSLMSVPCAPLLMGIHFELNIDAMSVWIHVIHSKASGWTCRVFSQDVSLICNYSSFKILCVNRSDEVFIICMSENTYILQHFLHFWVRGSELCLRNEKLWIDQMPWIAVLKNCCHIKITYADLLLLCT